MKGNNDDISKISNIQNILKIEYDGKYITGYILGNWKEAENVIQQYQVLTTYSAVEENVVHLISEIEVHKRNMQ